MKKTWKKAWGIILALALVLTAAAMPTASQNASAAGSGFTLYFYSEGEASLYLNIWNHAGLEFASDAVTSGDWGWDYKQGVLQPVAGNAGWYSIGLTVLDAAGNDGFDIYNGGNADGNKVATYDNQWNNVTDYAVLVGGSKDAYAVKGETVYTDLAAAGLVIDGSNEPAQPTEPAETVKPAESELYVGRIPNMGDDFIRGADISSVYSEYQSGVKYYDFSGKELVFSSTSGEKTFFDFLKESGHNWVRIRVWNNPYDASGNGYGGGNNDLATAKLIGKAATDAGLKVLIDFHYSDFWADPNMQGAPKAWKDFGLTKKAEELKKFTSESLVELFAAGVDVGMVQVGNETNNGLCGETVKENICTLFNAGSSAVREAANAVKKEVLVAIHYTNVQDAGYYDTVAKMLDDNKVDYDVFATSYYPFWHGTTENLTAVLKKVAETYNKKVMVAEVSYAYTLKDGDGHSNNVKEDAEGLVFHYATTVQGQANAIADTMRAVCNIGAAGLGTFYWEPAWIPVSVYDETAANAADILAANKAAWEKYGSGWASSYSAEYDPDNAGKWYGGSSWDNQAMFDFTGKPLESINVYKYVLTGTTAKAKLESVDDVSVAVLSDEDWKMPETVLAKYTDNSEKEVSVNWAEADVSAAKTGGVGTYKIHGTVAADGASFEILCTLEVKQPNLLKNPGFEEEDMSAWVINVISGGADCAGRVADSNKRTGEYSLKYWSEEPVNFTAEQTVALDKGIYELSAYNHGAVSDNGENALYQLYAVIDGKEYTVDSSVTSWQVWENPTISSLNVAKDNTKVTIGIKTTVNAGGWGAWDDFYLRKTGDLSVSEKETQSISGKSAYTKTYGAKAFTLNAKAEGALSYVSSNQAVASVGKDGKVTIKGTGKAVITVKAAETDKYQAASKKITITVKPQKVNGIKAKAGKKQVTVSWKKAAKASGYQIQYSTAKNFNGVKTVTAKGTSKKIKGLKSGKTYYVKVCAYAKDGKGKITGAYSKTLKIKVK